VRGFELLAVLIASTLVSAGCGSKSEQAPAPAVPAASAAPTGSAAVVTQASWAPDALEELLAPIALYPDQLVGQILAASVNPQEVLDGGNWLLENQELKGDALDAAAEKAGFGPAMRALVNFPTVVDMMCQEIDWTRQLGSAFTSDQKAVLDAVQRLRAQAVDVGNLKSSPEQTVESKTENNQVVVEVKPADPQVVYVPQYDPQAVYTTPAPATPAPAQTTESSDNTGAAVAAGLFAFGLGVMIGDAMHDDYYYPSWGYGSVYYGPHPFYPPAYVYRPVYGPAFHPAYHYAPPINYRYSYNHQTNVIINNNNYYNRFNNNGNLKRGETRSPLASTNRATTRDRDVSSRDRDQRGRDQSSWKGKSSYAGKDLGKSERPGQAPGGSARPNTPTAHNVDRGYGGSTRGTSERASTHSARAPASDHSTRAQAGDHSTRAPASASQPKTDHARSSASQPKTDHALSGASKSGSGSFDRASSARGHASASGGRAAGKAAAHRR
jgi:hypothetical protein